MNRSYGRSLSYAVVALFAALALGIGIASAHASLKSSIPVANSTVTTAPSSVTAVFDGDSSLAAQGSLLKVTDAAGKVVDNGDSALAKSDADRKTLTVSLKSGLANGVYTVNWTAVSEDDNDKEEGSFKFTIGAAAATTTAPTAPSNLPQTGAGDSSPWAIVPVAVLLLGLGMFVRRFAPRVGK